jgi:hypothetical protein
MSALRELIAAAEAAGWDTDAQNAPILNAAREALPEMLAERDRLREVNAELLGALMFILAFYEPGQTYLDTNAWKRAEASARAAVAKATGSAS